MKCLLCPREAAYQVRLYCCDVPKGIVYACSAVHAHKFRDNWEQSGVRINHLQVGIIELIGVDDAE